MPYCPHCTAYKHLPADPCECGLISDDIHPTPDPEPAPQVSDDMIQLLCLMVDGKSRHEAETYFGHTLREGYLRVRAMLAFLGHPHRQYVAGWRITERGRELVSRFTKEVA